MAFWSPIKDLGLVLPFANCNLEQVTPLCCLCLPYSPMTSSQILVCWSLVWGSVLVSKAFTFLLVESLYSLEKYNWRDKL